MLYLVIQLLQQFGRWNIDGGVALYSYARGEIDEQQLKEQLVDTTAKAATTYILPRQSELLWFCCKSDSSNGCIYYSKLCSYVYT